MRMRTWLLLPLLVMPGCGQEAVDTATVEPPPSAEASPIRDVAAQITMQVGEVRSFVPDPVDGKVPYVSVCGTYGPNGPDTTAVLVRVKSSMENAQYRAVAAGKVDLCSLPQQAVEACQPVPCADHTGDLERMITVTVEAA